MNLDSTTFLKRWLLTTVAVLVATQIVPGLSCDSLGGLLVTALLLGFLNVAVRPVLLLLSLPLVVVSLGLFLWVINAALLSFVGWIVKPFHVASFWSALGGAAVISVISFFGGLWLGLPSGVNLRTAGTRSRRGEPGSIPRRPPGQRGPGDGDGPVIDV